MERNQPAVSQLGSGGCSPGIDAEGIEANMCPQTIKFTRGGGSGKTETQPIRQLSWVGRRLGVVKVRIVTDHLQTCMI